MIDIDALLKNHFHGSSDDTSNPLVRTAASVLKKLAHQDEINQFIETNQHLDGLEFNDAVLEKGFFCRLITLQGKPTTQKILQIAGALEGK